MKLNENMNTKISSIDIGGEQVIYSDEVIRSIEEAEYEYDIEMEYGIHLMLQVKESHINENLICSVSE